MNKYYEAIRLIEETTKKSFNEEENYNLYKAIEIIYELLDIYIKEKTKVVYK